MRISELIPRLEEIREKYGDVEVMMEDPTFHSFCLFEIVRYDDEIKNCIIEW